MKHHAQQHRNLSSELSCAEERLKAARASLVKDKETLAQLKTNGLCTTELNREILDDLKSSVASEKAGAKIVSSTVKLETCISLILIAPPGSRIATLDYDNEQNMQHIFQENIFPKNHMENTCKHL